MKNKTEIQGLVEIFKKAGVLKEVKRTGWILKGVEEVESVADHTWRMELFVLLLTPPSLDRSKLLEMCVVHDLGETGVGDIKWETGKKIISSPKIKHKDEMQTMRDIFNGYEKADKYISLLQEFNEQKTPEAQFLKQIDKLEMALQALEYQQKGYPSVQFDEFWENAEKYLQRKSLEPIFRYLQELRKKSS